MKSSKLPKIEISLYFIFWISAIGYSVFAVFKAANDYFTSIYFEDTYNDFGEGLKWLHRKKDISDSEWKYVKIVIYALFPWCIVHIIISECLRKYNKQQLLIYWYTIISLLFVTFNFGIKSAIYFSIQPFFGYFPLQFKSKTIVWVYYLLSLSAINYYKYINSEVLNLHTYKEFVTTSAIFWINLRSLNYFLEVVSDTELRKFKLNNILTAYAYCLYLPFLFTGPLVLFTDFKNVFKSSNHLNLKQRFKELIINVMRYLFWFILIEFLLHIMYITALTYQPQIVNFINSWALYGAGYCMGQYFQMKYVVFYGLSSSLARFEGIPVPKTPKCIARIHLYSDMWKYFDRGLYLFLLRYIYIPLSASKSNVLKKLLASFICFLFVYVWHGIQSFILIWSLLNFIGVAIESICHLIFKTNIYQKVIFNNMSPAMHRRFICVLASPLFAMSCISNFYFFAGKEIGDIYVRRFLQGPMYVTFNILTVLYFGSQVSTEIKLWEKSFEEKKESRKTKEQLN